MSKKRVHEIAKELKGHGIELDNKEVVNELVSLGYDVKSHSSSLEDDQAVAAVQKIVDRRKPKAAPAPVAAKGFMVRRKAIDVVAAPAEVKAPPAAPPVEEPPAPPQVAEAPPTFDASPVPVAEVAVPAPHSSVPAAVVAAPRVSAPVVVPRRRRRGRRLPPRRLCRPRCVTPLCLVPRLCRRSPPGLRRRAHQCRARRLPK